MSTPDPFALGGRSQHDDAEILALFGQWREACRVFDQAEDDAALDRRDEIEDRIFALRGGAVALAVKAFLLLKHDRASGNWTPLIEQLRADTDDAQTVSILRDAATIVPAIADCAAAVIHEDAKLICADMDVRWATEMLNDLGARDHRRESRERLSAALVIIAETRAKTPRGEAIKAQSTALRPGN